MPKKIINELYPKGGRGYRSVIVQAKDVKGKCKQCGKCCSCITLSDYKNVFRKWIEKNRFKDKSFDEKAIKYRRQCLFIISNFVRVSRKECKKRNLPLDVPIYWCKQLKKSGNKFICKSHNNGKPELCKNYPKYGKRTRGEIGLNVGCGYLK